MAKRKSPRKRKPEYAPKRPVLSVRVDPNVFANISAEAKALNVSVTEVVYRRLLRYEAYKWTFGGTDAPNEPDIDVQLTALETALEMLGYTRIDGPGGAVWAEPGAKITYALPYPDLEVVITAAVERGIAKALKDRKE
jgi:hypothetical protein